jgi:hypothetical protein
MLKMETTYFITYIILPFSGFILMINILQILLDLKYPTRRMYNNTPINNYFHLYYLIATYFLFTISIFLDIILDNNNYIIDNTLLNLCTLILLIWITHSCNYHINILYNYCDNLFIENIVSDTPTEKTLKTKLHYFLKSIVAITFTNSSVSYILVYSLNKNLYLLINEFGIILSIIIIICILWYHIFKIHKHIAMVENEILNTSQNNDVVHEKQNSSHIPKKSSLNFVDEKKSPSNQKRLTDSSIILSLSPWIDNKMRSISVPSSPLHKKTSLTSPTFTIDRRTLTIDKQTLSKEEEKKSIFDYHITINTSESNQNNNINKREHIILRSDIPNEIKHTQLHSVEQLSISPNKLKSYETKSKIRVNKPLCLRNKSKKHMCYAFIGTLGMLIAVIFHINTIMFFITITSDSINFHNAIFITDFIDLNVLRILVIVLGLFFTKYLWIPLGKGKKVSPIIIKK